MTPELFGPTRRHKFLSLVDPELVEAPPWRSLRCLAIPRCERQGGTSSRALPAVLPKDPGTDYPAATENEAVALPFSPVEQDGLPAVTLGIPSGGQLDGADAVPTAVP